MINHIIKPFIKIFQHYIFSIIFRIVDLNIDLVISFNSLFIDFSNSHWYFSFLVHVILLRKSPISPLFLNYSKNYWALFWRAFGARQKLLSRALWKWSRVKLPPPKKNRNDGFIMHFCGQSRERAKTRGRERPDE